MAKINCECGKGPGLHLYGHDPQTGEPLSSVTYMIRQQQRIEEHERAEQQQRESVRPTRPAPAPSLTSTGPAQLDLAGGSNPLTTRGEQQTLGLVVPSVRPPTYPPLGSGQYHSPAWEGIVTQPPLGSSDGSTEEEG